MKNGTGASEVINALKEIFARHRIPDELVSDNGPQYSAFAFHQFSSLYGFRHTTSSPKFPQSNGESERAIQTIKNLLKKVKGGDMYSALLAYRVTSLQPGFSLAELLMGRKLRTKVAITTEGLTPNWTYLRTFQQEDAALRRSNTRNFNQRHSTKELPPLQLNTYVWISTTGAVLPNQGPSNPVRITFVRRVVVCVVIAGT